eukprot:scaffold1828_cov187-Ochromonas_danica.AAC.5
MSSHPEIPRLPISSTREKSFHGESNESSSPYSSARDNNGFSDPRWQLQNIPSVTTAPPQKPNNFDKNFWQLAMSLFLNVCHPSGQCDDSCNLIEDLVHLIEGSDQLSSPAAALALDVVVQIKLVVREELINMTVQVIV